MLYSGHLVISIADMLYSGHLVISIADMLYSGHLVISIADMLYSGHLVIADTFWILFFVFQTHSNSDAYYMNKEDISIL